MVGPELVIAVGEPSLALLSRLAGKLTRSFRLRFRVQRAVRKRTGISFPRRAFRRWLRRVADGDMLRPAEISGASLAADLDQSLGLAFEWAVQGDRRSKALSLVESTYAAVLELVTEPEARLLQASWSRFRHVDLLDRLVASSGTFTGLSRRDAAELLRRYSFARRSVRLAAFGVTAERIEGSFTATRSRVPDIPAGAIRVITGPFGSGKSEVAEAWHMECLETFENDPGHPHPLWLGASDLVHRRLEDRLADLMGSDLVNESGVAVVIDGLDEVDAQVASRLVEQSQVFVSVHTNCCVLLTSRPGVVDSQPFALEWKGLTRDEAMQLVNAVAGNEPSSWSWEDAFVESISRPFFALAAGVVLAEGARPAGQADLIRRLVESALADAPTNAAAVAPGERFEALKRLAFNLTDSGGERDGLDFRTRNVVRETTLVRSRSTGVCEFSLPIFQQWFAAQAMLSDPAGAAELCAAPETFDRWRWAIAVACLAADQSQLDALVAACYRGNTGAAGWVLQQVSEGHHWVSESGVDRGSVGTRLLTATRSTIDALGVLAPLYFPVRSATESFTLGVRVDGSSVTLGWRTWSESSDQVLELPADVHPLNFKAERQDWVPDRSGPVPEGLEWTWRLVQERIAGRTLDILNGHPQVGPRFGVWHAESMYDAARQLMRMSSVRFEPMSAVEVRARAQEVLDLLGDPETGVLRLGRRDISGTVIRDLADWLDSNSGAQLKRALPAPDVDPALSGGWVWGLYSDVQLQSFYAEAYEHSCVAYDEAVASLFSRFAWSMGTGAGGDFGVVGDLSYRSGTSFGARAPGIVTARVPLERLGELAAERSGYLSQNGRALVTLSPDDSTKSWVELMMRETWSTGSRRNPFARYGVTTSVADLSHHRRPASQIAARWLFNDLKAVGMASGTFPQLDN